AGVSWVRSGWPCWRWEEASSRQRRMALPAVRRTTPLVNMLASGRAGLSCMVVVERMVSTTPQTTSTRALSSSTRQSEKPPLFRSSIWSRLRMQFMSWIAELSSCFSSTSRARRQSVVPTASRHSPDRLLVLYSRMMPPIPQHRMDFLGSWNHQSSTCSSKMAASFLSCVFHLKKSRREDIIKQRPCSPEPNNPLPNPGPWLLQTGLKTFPCLPHNSPMQLEHRSVTHARLQGDFHALLGDLSLRQGRVSCLPSPVCPAQRLLAHRCPQESACSWCWQQGRDGAEASPSWDKAPFTAPASHAPSSASASCHQLALLPRMTSGDGGQDRGLTLSVQSLEERELPLLHVPSLVPTPALLAVPPPKFPTEI
uniref:Uncharacterized protein n=1 Tax=Buteo japonicus TaxID=224669 RepID=A0A8C0BXM8_9AVES